MAARRRVAAGMAGAALLAAAVLGGLARPVLERPVARPEAAPEGEQAGFDAERVVETVSHHVAPDPDRPGALVAEDDAYRASFDSVGFTLRSPQGPEAFALSLRELARGEDPIALTPGPWRGEANVATRPVGRGITERVTARDGEVEWDLVLAARPPGGGDLVAEARVEGVDSVGLGQLVVIDATGAELHRASPRVRGDRLRLTVPTRVLERARYPLTLDPSVTPEFFASPTPAPAVQAVSAVAVGPSGDYLVVWQDNPGFANSQRIFGTRVSRSGTVLDPAGIPISTGPGLQFDPAVAFDGTNFVVVWGDTRSISTTGMDVYGARVSQSGTVLDPAGVPVSDEAGDQLFPDVAFDGTNFLVVWEDRRSGSDDVFGARVSTAGVVLESSGTPISTAANNQSEPTVAFDGTNYLVVWHDSRSGASDVNIFGARVSTAGVVLDPTVPGGGLAISTAPGGQFHPDLAFDGTNYLVVWRAASGTASDPGIHATRVSTSGAVLDSSPDIFIATADFTADPPGVAFDGTNYHVVWSDSPTGASDTSDIFSARVSTAGSVAGSGTLISGAASTQGFPAVVFDGTRLLVVWQDSRSDSTGGQRDIFGTRLETNGIVPDPVGTLISTRANTQSNPAVAFDASGGTHLVVWSDTRSGNTDIYGARVTASGSVLDPFGIAIATGTSAQTAPAVAFGGPHFLVVWQEGTITTSDIRGAFVSAFDGEVFALGVPVASAANAQAVPAIAFDGTRHLVAWADNRSGSFDIRGARVATNGQVLDAGILSPTAGDQVAPALAFGGGNFLVAWQQGIFGFSDIFASRVSTEGTVLGTAGFAISTAPNDQSNAAVASDGTNHLVVWDDRRAGSASGPADVYGTRVDPSGTVLETAGIPISTAPDNQQFPTVAFNGAYLVAWRDRRSGGFDVFGARVAADGTVQDGSGFAIAASSNAEGVPAVARGSGSNWRAVYPRDYPGGSGIFLRGVAPK